jgi:hypothetical protein
MKRRSKKEAAKKRRRIKKKGRGKRYLKLAERAV